MAVHVDSSGRHFQLDAGDSSYVLEATEEGALAHWYWGPKLRSSSPVRRRELLVPRAFAPRPFPEHEEFSLDVLPQEYPTWGRGDFRSPAYQVRLDDGSAVTDLRFQAYRHVPGKPRLAGLPRIYVDDPQSPVRRDFNRGPVRCSSRLDGRVGVYGVGGPQRDCALGKVL